MLFKPSPKTVKLNRRASRLFFPLWIGSLVYSWLIAEEMISSEWNKVFVPVFGVLFTVSFVHGLIALNSARQDAMKSQHPDPNVAALIDGEIDIAEYGRRKAHASAISTSANSESSPQKGTTQNDM